MITDEMKLNDWKIDKSAGRPILTYKGCSVIEAEDAEFVLSAIKAALSAAEPVVWQLVPTEPTDDMIEAFRQAHALKCADIASHTPTEHPEDGGGPIGYGYRAMLHAAPAKQD